MIEDIKKLLPDEKLEFISKWTSETDLEKLRSHVLKIWEASKKNYWIYDCIQKWFFCLHY